MEGKIIQIAVSEKGIYALTDAGKIYWSSGYSHKGAWYEREMDEVN